MATDAVGHARRRPQPLGAGHVPHAEDGRAALGDRESARADRTHGAEGVIPTPLWIVLFLTAGVIFVFMLFFADSGERAIVQGTMMGSVAVVISSTLLLLWFLDHPYSNSVGGLRPAAMERTVGQLTH